VSFAEYLEHGWRLVPITPGQKGPRKREWNKRENAITDPSVQLQSAGLAHAYSGTCAIDVDDYPFARNWLLDHGIDLDALFSARDSVQISSGRAGHGKLLYSLPEPLASKKIALNDEGKSALDLRCATANGLTVQDVLPPSIHPDTGMPYTWIYGDPLFAHWSALPPIPPDLHKLWVDSLVDVSNPEHVPDKGASLDELRMLLSQQDPDMGRDDWVRVGMAIHHETDGSDAGLALWDEWSQRSDKYVSYQDCATCWRSFHDTPNAVTVGMLRQNVVAQVHDFEEVTGEPPEYDPWEEEKQRKRRRFELVPVAEIAERPPTEWLVEGLVPQADLAMMYGPPGAGKSFAALDLAFCIANGFTWFNRATKIGTVVWVAAEAAGSMRNRAKAYAQAKGVALDKCDLWIMEQTMTFMDPDDAAGLMACVTEKQPSLIIVDTLAAASGGANENSGEDMNVVLDNCRKLHEATGALVMLVHHTGKDTSRGARGWSGLKGAMHTELSVYQIEGSATRMMESTKQRDSADGEKFPFRLQVVPIGMDGTESCVVETLDEVLIDSNDIKNRLRGNQKLIFQVVFELSDEDDPQVPIQDVYDQAIPRLPPPDSSKRDRRAEVVKRAVEKLHENGYLTVRNGYVTIGSPLDD
tara:strand:- start:8652 stop:10568 length:1917 start_codon:yes stop_codon:yes gene_type:complete